MDGPEIPPYFLCPISLQIMKDPVTVSTGISYDRNSIVRWLSVYGRNTCPVTNQALVDATLTPNTTLLRLIRSWTAAGGAQNSKSSTIAAPKPGFDISGILRDLSDAATDTIFQLKLLKKITSLVQDNPDSIAGMEIAGVASLVASLIITRSEPQEASSRIDDPSAVADEATSVLHLLKPSPGTLKQVAERKNAELISSLSLLLQRGPRRARIHAALLLQSIFKVVDDGYKAELPADLFDGVAEMLKDQNSGRAATLALLSLLIEVVPFGRNPAKVVEAGAVGVMVELLMEETGDKRKCEAMLYLLELVCRSAEGRAALAAHPAGVAVVAGKTLRVSSAATERAVRVLGLVCKHCKAVEEMVVVGGAARLCMVAQLGSGKSREKAKDILGKHSAAWSNFPCFHSFRLP